MRRSTKSLCTAVLASGVLLLAAAPAPAQTTCETNVTFGLVEATTAGCLNRIAPGHWESADKVILNGLPLVPAPGTKLTLRGPSGAAPGGSLSVDASVTLQGVTFHRGLLSVKFPQGVQGEEKSVGPFVVPPPAAPFVQTVLGLVQASADRLRIGGSVALRIGYGSNGQHYSILRLGVKLPPQFKSGPNPSSGGLTGTLALRADSGGLHVDGAKIEVPHAYLGRVELASLCLSYTGAGATTAPCAAPAGAALTNCAAASTSQHRWDGAAAVVLPTQSHPRFGVFAGVRGNAFGYAGATASLGNTAPLGYGLFLDKIGLAVCANPAPVRVKGTGAVRWGPQFGSANAAYLEGSFEYVGSQPWTIRADGSLALFGFNVGNSHMLFKSTGAIELGADAHFDFGAASMSSQVLGWYDPGPPERYNIEGSGQVCVASVACSGGQVVVSQKGVAGCITLITTTYWVLVKDADWKPWAPWRVHWEQRTASLRAGAGYHWSPAHLTLMGNSCDIGPYRAIRRAAAGDFTVRLGSAPAAALGIVGRDAAPRVRLKGPDGTVVESPPPGESGGGQVKPGSYALAEDPAARTTSVTIARPAAGDWTVTPLEGSSPIERVDTAPSVPPATFAGGVSGSGRKRVLTYAFDADPSRSVLLVERGRNTTQVLGAAGGKTCPHAQKTPADRTAARCGRLVFTPARGPGGKRDIVAVSYADELAIGQAPVASYSAPAEPLPQRPPSLSLTRGRRGIEVRWADATGVDRWNLAVTRTDGDRVLDVVDGGTERALIGGVASGTGVTLTLTGIRADGRQGPALVATLGGGRPAVRVRSRR